MEETEVGSGNLPLSVSISRPIAPVREQVLAQLRQAIVDGSLRPGRRLLERELIAATGTSRTTVREVLRQLAAESLVTPTPNKGVVVTSMPLERAMELYQVRCVLEGMAAEQFAERATDDEIVDLRAALTTIRELSIRSDPESRAAQLSALRGFYDILLAGSRNLIVREVLEGLQARVAAYRSMSMTPSRARQAADEMDAIVSAIEDRDGQRAAQATDHHIRQSARAIRHLFRGARQDPGAATSVEFADL